MTTLAAALAYRNDDVVDRFTASFDLPRAEAELLFEDVLRWMWLNTRANGRNVRLFIDLKMTLLDEMWHTFILFTRDYAAFCDTYLGRFCHHQPTRRADREEAARRAAADPNAFAASLREDYTAFITLVARELGEDVATRWFDTYRKKHTEAFIRSIHKYARPGVP